MRRLRLKSLSSRLVLTTVSLVGLVTVLVGLVTTLAVRAYLVNQLDDQVAASVERARQAPVFGVTGGPATPDPP